ncbi:MAG: ATP-binding protein [Candidatus Polarisedimenticolaceae bacterium]|nr:ATP-binding protein [Candidatus Polarisedimenticolaceae bacterium]
MGRLFWKIFLWFWLAMIMMTIGVFFIMSQLLQQQEVVSPLGRMAEPQVAAVASAIKHGGEFAAKSFLREQMVHSPIQIMVINDQGQELLGRQLSGKPPEDGESVQSPTGQHFQVYAEHAIHGRSFLTLNHTPPFALLRSNGGDLSPWIIILRFTISILISGLVCFWLAWYLAKPIQHLRKATQQLAEGQLDVRVGPSSGGRRDEIADLGQDFDRMAGRLQQLMLAQRQLLTDVSHELRSPLARLQVALELARRKSGELAADELNRIEREANRLDDLVGQVLTLSRLEAGVFESREDYIDIALLLEEIVQDAEFESIGQRRHVTLHYNSSKIIKANGELLRRALENMVRNAMHYTADETQVDVTLKESVEQPNWITVTVCDRGPGVAEERLADLFEPFFRVAESRSRDSGGYGLGLAIAKRAIDLHEGTVSARNRSGVGLCVTIELPTYSKE